VAAAHQLATLKKAAKRAGIDPKHGNRYMLRHYMARHVRSVAAVAVSREERAARMGHADPEHSTRFWYETFDRDHLNPMHATDAIKERLAQLTRRTLVSPDMHRQQISWC
jgi:hypothetical protein